MSYLRNRIFVCKASHVKSRFLRIYTLISFWTNQVVRARVLLFDVLALEPVKSSGELLQQLLLVYPQILDDTYYKEDVLLDTIRVLVSFNQHGTALTPTFNNIMTKILSSDLAPLSNEIRSLQILAPRLDSQEAATQMIRISELLSQKPPIPIFKFKAMVLTLAYLSRHTHEHVDIASNHMRSAFEDLLKQGDINEQIVVASALVIMARCDEHTEKVMEWKSRLDGRIVLPQFVSKLNK
jgi:hypothetical protein